MRSPLLSPSFSALKIALIYAFVSAVWILFSDLLVSQIATGRQATNLSIAKGWGFVLITGVLLYILVKRDMNRVVQAEARLRVLFDSVNDAIYVSVMDDKGKLGKFTEVNHEAIKRLGYTVPEFLDMSAWDITKPDLCRKVIRKARYLRLNGKVTFDSVHLDKNGREIPVEISARTVEMGDETLVITVARDVTERKNAEAERRQTERDKRQFYRQTILAVTGGKFELAEPEEAELWLDGHELVVELNGPEDVSEARRKAVDFFRQKGLSADRSADFELSLGEALGNAVKHAGSGCMYAGNRNGVLWAAVVDQGSGIDTFAIPKVALMPGYTTQASMGLGYTLMLETSDRVRLATGPKGTTVVMEKDLRETSEIEQRIAIHNAIK